MKKLFLLLVSLLVIIGGCQADKKTSRKEALDHWNNARGDLAMKMARQQYQAGELKEAQASVRNILAKNAEYVPAHMLMGQIHFELNQPAEAKKCFETCLKIQPKSHEAKYRLGMVYEKWNDGAAALEHYRQALTEKPDHIPYLLAVAETLANQGKYAEALEMLKPRLNEQVQDASVYVMCGNIYCLQGQYAQALPMYESAANMAPENKGIRESLAFAYYRAGKPAQALDMFETMMLEAKKDGRNLDWAYHLAIGDCYLRLGRYHDARRRFEYLSEQNVVRPLIWTKMAQAELGSDNQARAEHCAKMALELSPDEPDALLVLGYLALKQQDFPQAQNCFTRIVNQDSKHSLAWCLLGQAVQEQGKPDLARKYYNYALRVNPQETLAQRLLSTLPETQIGAASTIQKH